MRVLVDANFLIHLIDHREGGTKPNQLRHQKLSWLLKSIVSKRGKIIIPTPALSEYLVNARAASEVRISANVTGHFGHRDRRQWAH